MPQGGSFPNIPDMPVGGSDLLANKATTYKNYTCTKVVATGDTKTFDYIPRAGVVAITITVGTQVGDSLEFVINPSQLTRANDVMFFCNSCDCDQPMTGTTEFYDTGYGYINSGATTVGNQGLRNPNTAFAPTIIGGNGLNN